MNTARISLPILLSIMVLVGCGPAMTVPDQSGAEPDTSPTLLRYQSACESGSAEGCYDLGLAYEYGKYGVEVDRDRAFELYQAACRGDVAAGCTNLGVFNEHGYSTPKDHVRAAELYQRGCELGNSVGCTNLGLARVAGRGVPQDYGAAYDLFEYSCKLGHGRGCSELGVLYRKGRGVDVDEERAAELYGQGCNMGDATSCTRWGWLYENGRGVEQDRQRAATLYRQACEGGNATGCTNLGWFYEFGRAVEEDLEKAANRYAQGCDLGSARGCYQLGELYREGNGVSEELARAMELYEKACDGDYSQGCRRLGEVYIGDDDVSEDRQRALQYFATGCEGGDSSSCQSLARYADKPEWDADLLKACEIDGNICLPSARVLVERGTEESVTLAARLLDTGCENDLLPSCRGRVALRHAVFEERYENGCQDDDGVACLKLASVWNFDYGDQCRLPERELADDEELASRCADGDGEACWLRGVWLMHSASEDSSLLGAVGLGGMGLRERGDDASKAEIQARHLEGCEAGDAEECISLGHHLRRHDEPERAGEYFEAGCDLGSEEGCHILAMELVDSDDEGDIERGLELLEGACDADRIPACLDLADIHLEEEDPEHEVVVDLMARGCQDGETRGCWKLTQYFDQRSDELHDRACALHFSFQECTLENWSSCHTFDVE